MGSERSEIARHTQVDTTATTGDEDCLTFEEVLWK
jgi:hypothetical protein